MKFLERILRWAACIAAGLLCVFLILVFIGPREIAALSLGWWHFLRRNVSLLTWNWTLVATGMLLSIALLVLGHVLLGTLYRWLGQSRRWRFGWTFSMYATLWILFVIAVGTAGLFDHVVWLLNDLSPRYAMRNSAEMTVRTVDLFLESQVEEDIEHGYRAYFAQRPLFHQGVSLLEDFDLILFGDPQKKIAAYALIPRSGNEEKEGYFLVATTGTNGPGYFYRQTYPLSEVTQKIAELDRQYPLTPPANRAP